MTEQEPWEVPEEFDFQKLIQALLDPEKTFPVDYIYHLSDLEEKELQSLRDAWMDVPAWRRRDVLKEAEAIGEVDFLLSFQALARFAVEDEDSQVRLSALRALRVFEEPDLIPVFLDHLRTEESPLLKSAAATCLGTFVYKGELEEIPPETKTEIEDALLEVAHGSDNELARKAMEALSFSERKEVVALIETAYFSGNREWVASALYSMGRSANKRWQPQVMAELGSADVDIREQAARAAGELNIRESLEPLLDLMEDPDEHVRNAAIWSLSQLGGEGVRDALEYAYGEARDEEEEEFLENALDNLAFTEEVELFGLFDFSDEDIPPAGGEQEDEGPAV